jgi:hypothetical protein
MRQARFHIHTDVSFNAEIPLPTLSRLMHLRVARLRRIFGRRRCMDDRIHDRALTQQQPFVRQISVDRRQHLRRQIVSLQQSAKVENRGLIGHAALGEEAVRLRHQTRLPERQPRRTV